MASEWPAEGLKGTEGGIGFWEELIGIVAFGLELGFSVWDVLLNLIIKPLINLNYFYFLSTLTYNSENKTKSLQQS